MARTESPAEIKDRLVQQLRSARAGLATQAGLAKEEYSPMAIATRSFINHKAAWIAGGVVTGLLAIKLLLPSKNRSDISGKSARTRGLSGMLRGLFLTFAQRAALNYAKDQLQKNFKNQFQDSVASFFNPQSPPPPNRPRH